MLYTEPFPILATTLLANILVGSEVVVKVPELGAIKGQVNRTEPDGLLGINRDFYSFTAIPYGNILERFLPAEMRVPLVGGDGEIFDATKRQLPCWQHNHPLSLPPYTEDCLTLNIYTPKIPSSDKDTLLPVIFFIHGGAFQFGSGNSYDGRRLLNRDVVLVTINYRLNIFGFLSFENDEAPGNVGLYDQLLALKWVNRYIRHFGGDPTRVTLAGQSAGSASVRYLTDSPLADGLYHGAIAASGDSIAHWATQRNPKEGGLAAASKVGCYDSSDSTQTLESALKCLKSLSPTALLEARDSLMAVPCTQSFTLRTHEKIVPIHPYELMRSGQKSRRPLMLGAAKNDGSFMTGDMYTNFYKTSTRKNDPTYMKYEFLPDLLQSGYFGIKDFPVGMHDTIIQTFFGNDKYSGEWSRLAPGVVDMATVMMLKGPAFHTAKEFSQHVDTYLYSFEYYGNQTWYHEMAGVDEVPRGCTHADDLMYVFFNGTFKSAQDKLMSTAMIDLWTNFATNLNPNGALTLPSWPKFTRDTGAYYKINTICTVGTDYVRPWFGASHWLTN